MALTNELAYTTAVELAARIRRRELSPVEVIEAFVERIEARNDSLNALVYLGFDDARQRAREAEQALVSGADLGVLHGVPTAIKDLFDFKPGWPATFGGVRALKDFTLDASCMFAERIQRAGAIVLGKTNSPIMGFRGTCDNYLFGPSRNPFAPAKNTGGSSGGSAAAVADGLLPLAEGTDGGGSIRIPASWCGVYGYKASFGRIPYVNRPNAFAGINPFLFEGPITRTVEDAALALDALAGYDSRDPFSLDQAERFTPAVQHSISGWRIAYSPDFEVFPVDKRVTEVVGTAVRAFEEAGAQVEEVRPARRPPRRLPAGVPAVDRRGVPHERVGPLPRPAGPVGDLRRDPAGPGRLSPAGHPDPGLLAGGQRRRWQHRRSQPHQRRGGRPADRLVPHVLRQILRPPGGVDPRRTGRRAPGRHAADRPPLR
jgi:amidase